MATDSSHERIRDLNHSAQAVWARFTRRETHGWTGSSPLVITPEFAWALRPTHSNENRFESARIRSSERGTAKVVVTLDKARPFPSLIWNVRF